MGQRVKGAPEAFFYDAFFQRYGWDYPTVRETPEWLLEELTSVMEGEAEGMRLVRAKMVIGAQTGGVDDGPDESAAAYAARKGLPMPPGGWPMPVRPDA